MVYGYTDSLFPLSYLYREMGFGESPFLGSSPKTSSQRAPTVGGGLPDIIYAKLSISPRYNEKTLSLFIDLCWP